METKEAPVASVTDTLVQTKEIAPVAEVKEIKEEKVTLDMKEIVRQVKEQALAELHVQNKVVKQQVKEGVNTMETKEIPLSVKEMQGHAKSGNLLQFKEAASQYMLEHKERIDSQLQGAGIPLRPTLQVKCVGNKLQIAGGLQVKSALDTSTNPGAYTESIVEFADLFIPGLIETFNNQANLFGALRKVDHLMGGSFYGWKIKTDQAGALSVDPDDPSVSFNPVDKLKLRTEMKEYRVGVSVTDYVAHHARATMGDLLMLEAQARMGDMMRDINDDLYTAQVDSGNQVIGLMAVADAATNTSLYGKTRSTTNRLAPATATDTYVAVGGALTTALIRNGLSLVEIEGARRDNLRIVVGPAVRDDLFELLDGQQHLFTNPDFGFNGGIRFDGVPVIVDSSCQSDSLYIIDMESCYLVISRAPQLIGLAKVGAAESAYISTFLALVYEQPRRIHMLDTLS